MLSPQLPMRWHVVEQPLPSLVVLPSSPTANSDGAPPFAFLHALLHASLLPLFASSHGSLGPVTPSPQPGRVQLLRQPSLSTLLPSSHCSPAWRLRWPSRHNASVQSASQPADSPPS